MLLRPAVVFNQSLYSGSTVVAFVANLQQQLPFRLKGPFGRGLRKLRHQLGDFRGRDHCHQVLGRGACSAGARHIALAAAFVERSHGHGQVERHIGHVNLRVADREVSKRFYRDQLGFVIAEEDPEHGGVFMTLGDNFHTVDIGQHPAPETARRPERGQIARPHRISGRQLRGLARRLRSPCRQRRRDPARHKPHQSAQLLFRRSRRQRTRDLLRVAARVELFPEGRADQDEALKVNGPGDPLPDWLLEDWPPMKARIESVRRASA